MSPLGLDSGRLVYGAYWMEEKLVVERLIIETGLLAKRRGIGSIGWSVA